IGVIFEDVRISYRELNDRANRVAHSLIGSGAGPEKLVAIALKRSPDMIVALLGVLKSGAAYLPLDLELPEARLAYMLSDASPAMVLTHSTLKARLPQGAGLICIDDPEFQSAVNQASSRNPNDTDRACCLLPHHPAYVIYTSGSTGNPK